MKIILFTRQVFAPEQNKLPHLIKNPPRVPFSAESASLYPR